MLLCLVGELNNFITFAVCPYRVPIDLHIHHFLTIKLILHKARTKKHIKVNEKQKNLFDSKK